MAWRERAVEAVRHLLEVERRRSSVKDELSLLLKLPAPRCALGEMRALRTAISRSSSRQADGSIHPHLSSPGGRSAGPAVPVDVDGDHLAEKEVG